MIILGSQVILGSLGEDELSVEATMSVEAAVLPIADRNTVTAELADLIDDVAAEWSPFEDQHGFSSEGVDLNTAVPPEGWRDRLVRVQNLNTAAPSGQPQFIGWCLDPKDLCVAELCAHREEDLNFVRALRIRGCGALEAARSGRRASTQCLSRPCVNHIALIHGAGKHGTSRHKPLTHNLEDEFVPAGERGQVRAFEGSVGPTPSSHYTINCEEPSVVEDENPPIIIVNRPP